MLGQCLRVRIPWNFEISHDMLKARSDGRLCCCTSLRISAIGLTLGGMMHTNMKQIAIQNGHARPIFARSTKLCHFQKRLGPGPREYVTALTLSGFQLLAWNLWPAKFCALYGTLTFFMIYFGQKDAIEKIALLPEIWWHDAVYHEADHCMKWSHSANIRIFWSR